MIEVKKISEQQFLVKVKEELIKKSFEFLLERESKESILSEFNLRIIRNYFPEYEKKSKHKNLGGKMADIKDNVEEILKKTTRRNAVSCRG